MKAQNRECKKKEKPLFVLHLFLLRPSRLHLLLDSTKPQTDIQVRLLLAPYIVLGVVLKFGVTLNLITDQ